MRDASIWVVLTDGTTARICHGDHTITIAPAAAAGWDVTMAAQYSGQLVSDVADLLHCGASDGACCGLILVATPHIIGELRDALSLQSRSLLIGEIVRGCDNATAMTSFARATCH